VLDAKNNTGTSWKRLGSAMASQYLTRLTLQNQFFGNDVRLISLARCNQKLRVITPQPHVVGELAKTKDIQTWFHEMGYSRIGANGSFAWYEKDINLLVSDEAVRL
jgi:hypothetical protein